MRTRSVVPRMRRRWAVAAVMVCAGAFAGCSDSDDEEDVAPTTTITAAAPETDPTSSELAPTTVEPIGTTSESVAPSTTASDPGEATTVPATIPTDGVPGIDDDEVVCRSWSRIAGTFQVVAVASAFGEDDPIAPARLEVSGAPVVVAARDALVESWPDELVDEAEAVAQDYLGPFVRRSERALAELVAAGATAEQLDLLADAWIDALANRGLDDPSLTVDLPAELRSIVEAAAVSFDRDVPPIPQDPSLVTDVAVPATEAFVAQRCPDRGTLAGSDPVGGP